MSSAAVAPRPTDEPALRAFLARVHQEVVPLGPRQYLAVERLLQGREDWTSREMGAALASLLARDEEEWREVRELWRQFVARRRGQPKAEAFKTPRPGEGAPQDNEPIALAAVPLTVSTEPIWERLRRSSGRALSAAQDLPRGIWMGLVSGLFGLGVFFVVSNLPPPEAAPSIEAPSGQVPQVGEQTQSEFLLLEVEAESQVLGASRRLVPPPEPASVLALLAGLSLVLSLLGLRLVQLPAAARRAREGAAKGRRRATSEERRRLEEEKARSGRRPQVSYRVERHLAVSRQAILDSADLLGRLFREQPGEELDAGGTLRRTVDAAGRFTPVLAPRRARQEVLVLVDQEKGDHPWLGAFLRVVEAWRVLGVRLVCYDFQHNPAFLVDPETGRGLAIEDVARRTEGLPLLLFSRQLRPESRRGEAPWLQEIGAWPQRAWLDPDPRPLGQFAPPRQGEISHLESAGLPRFPLSDDGVVSLARYLASEGESVHRLDPPPLPPLPSTGPLAAALRRWALAAALVPDPSWDQLEAIRREFSEIHELLPGRRSLQLLLQWVERETGKPAERPGGRVLNVPEAAQNLWLEEERRRAAREGDDFEGRVRKLLLKQLEPTRPDDELDRQWWQFKRSLHQAVLEPQRALELLAWVYNSPIAHEASRWIEHEIERQKRVRGVEFSRATVDALEHFGGRTKGVGFLDLWWGFGRVWQRSLAGLLAIVALPALAGWGWTADPVRKFLASEVRDIEGRLPATYRLGPEMITLPGGAFQMGSERGIETGQPVHTVTLPSFQISRTEVTVAEYRPCVDAGVCAEPQSGQTCNWDRSGREDHPINCVSWDDASTFARWVGARLPSEVEWEFAAKGGGHSVTYPWGEEPANCRRAVISTDVEGAGCGRRSTWPVCSKEEGNTRQNLCDMAGNVREWVEDDWHSDYWNAPSTRELREEGAPRSAYRVIRGGSWSSSAQYARVAYRGRLVPVYRDGVVGFRVARSLPSDD